MILVSIITPTYKRPQLLRRAINSVLLQSYTNWELIVSDDEVAFGETWGYLMEMSRSDKRIRGLKNQGTHGQVGNVNNALIQAKGEWVKPLFDDDVLLPDCLEMFVKAVMPHPTVALAGCLAMRYRNNCCIRVDNKPTKKMIEIVKQPYVHLAMYLQDFECGGMPTQMFINRKAIDAGAVMPSDMRFVSGVDQLWFAEILKHGDRLHLALPLVEEHQGLSETVTSGMSRTDLDKENILLKQYYRSLICLPGNPIPVLRVVEQMTWGIRGLHRICSRHILEGCFLILKVHSVAAWLLVFKWLMRKCFPGYFGAVPRERFDFV